MTLRLPLPQADRLAACVLAALIGLCACGKVRDGASDASGGACENNDQCSLSSPICDTESSTCRGCSESLECQGSAGGELCEIATGACVECIENADCGMQVCDPQTRTCRGCESHDECDSEICDQAGGECVAESRILYVDNEAASPGSNCTKDEPCLNSATAAEKFAADRDWMRIRPTDQAYESFAVITFDGAHVCADGATFDLTSFNGTEDVFFRVEPGADATIVGGTYQNSSRLALSCGTDGSAKAHLRVQDATFTNVDGAILAAHCDVELFDSDITGSTGIAVLAKETTPMSDFIVARNRITGGDAGAISFPGRSLSLRNNLIAENLQGTPVLYRVLDLNGAQQAQIVNNTITGHPGTDETLEDVILWCAGGEESPTVANNILWGNQLDNVFIECSSDFDVSPNITANILELEGTEQDIYPDNTFTDPLFENAPGGDYTPGENSPALDAADATLAPPVDLNGQSRDAGDGPDIGAIERQ